MSFGGPIDSMINTNKQNRRLLGKRKKLKEIYDEYEHSTKDPVRIQPANKNCFEDFIARFDKEKNNERQRVLLIIGLTLIITLSLLLWVVTADYSSIIDVIK